MCIFFVGFSFAVSEEQCLHEIYIDEHFGLPNKSGEEEKKK